MNTKIIASYFKAVKMNNLKNIESILSKNKIDVDIRDEDDGTALMYAVGYNHKESVDLLLSRGADPFAMNNEGFDALWVANEVDADIDIKYKLIKTIVDKKKYFSTEKIICKDDLLYHLYQYRKLIIKNIKQKNKTYSCTLWYIDKLLKLLDRNFLNNKIIQNQQKAQTKFFNFLRSKNTMTRNLLTVFKNNRKTTEISQAINAEKVPRRRLITADAGAVKAVLNKVKAPRQVLTNSDAIANKLDWNKKGNMDWKREKIITSVGEINYQHRPYPGHLGNFFMSGLGSYGKQKNNDILSVINTLTCTDSPNIKQQYENEKKLATLMLNSSKTGISITKYQLEKHGFQLFKCNKTNITLVARLNRVCYLFSVKEITRRMHTGPTNQGEYRKELPFAVAYYRALKLISQDKLHFKDVFDRDAPYGLPTGSDLQTARSWEKVEGKLIELNKLFGIYCKNSYIEDVSQEKFHQELLEAYGGDEDSSGDEYSSGSEDQEIKLRIGPR